MPIEDCSIAFERAVTLDNSLPNAVSDELLALLNDVDDIWHYGIRVASGDDVSRLHERFRVLVEADPNYRLRSADVVANRWHGSMHTKLASRDAGVEIEFLSYEVDWTN